MRMQTSLGATALGGAVSTVALALADQVWGFKFHDPAVQGALQTVFTFLVVFVAKLTEALLLKANIKLPDDEQEKELPK